MSRFLSLYTPSTQSHDVLEKLLVGRTETVERVVKDIVESVTTNAKYHHLLVGPRGIGKTHLVSVVYHRLRRLEVAECRTAWIREDPWGMRNFDRFLRSVARAVAFDAGEPELLRGSGETASAFLCRLAGTGTIVLIAENLDSIFLRIADDGQRQLRAFIQNEGKLVILGTTPTLFDGVTKQNSALYGSFLINKLDELTLAEAQDLLDRVASLRGDHELAKVIWTDHGRRRLAVIKHLAGGHPRLWMLFADCLSVGALDDLVPLFLKALDDLTPYYQDRMRGLEGYQEEIVAYLCEERGARTVGDIASACGIAPNAASTQLAKLAEKGFVRKAELEADVHTGDRRSTYFELREPLMRLCLDVKEARGRPIQLIVDFLQAWFDVGELAAHLKLGGTDNLGRQYLLAALGDTGRSVSETREGASSSTHELIAIPSEPARSAAAKTALEWGRLAEARQMYESLVSDLTERNGDSHVETLAARHNLAVVWSAAGELDRPLRELTDITAAYERILGNEHPDTLTARANLASSYGSAGRILEMLDLLDNISQSTNDSRYLIHVLSGSLGPAKAWQPELVTWAKSNAPVELGWAALATVASKQGDPRAAAAAAESWRSVIGELAEAEVPLRIAAAIVEWSQDHDRKHLLALPSEERAVAIQLLGL